MSKSIKLDDKVYSELEEVRLKKETYSQAVARLINHYRDLTKLAWSHTGEHPGTPGQAAQRITQEVCQAYGFSPEFLKDGRRTRTASQIRWEITERLRKETPLSLVEIGELLGRSKSYRGRKIKR